MPTIMKTHMTVQKPGVVLVTIISLIQKDRRLFLRIVNFAYRPTAYFKLCAENNVTTKLPEYPWH